MPWPKGKSRSEHAIQATVEKNKGQKRTPEQRKRISEGQKRFYVANPNFARCRGEKLQTPLTRLRQALGWAPGTGTLVHHLNFDETDNRLENGVILTRSQHVRLHTAVRMLKRLFAEEFRLATPTLGVLVREIEEG